MVAPPESALAELPDDEIVGIPELDPAFVDAAQQSHRARVAGELWILRRLLDISIEDYRVGGKRREAVAPWFFGEPERPITGWTFDFVCEHLDVDPDRIRRSLEHAKPSRSRRVTSGNSFRDKRRAA